MSEPFVITVWFGPLHQILGEMRTATEPTPDPVNRGIRHFDFDLLPVDDRCPECNQPEDNHCGDCLGIN